MFDEYKTNKKIFFNGFKNIFEYLALYYSNSIYKK